MALTVTALTVQNITRVNGTVAAAAGSTVTNTVIFAQPGALGFGGGGNIERFRIKVIRLVWINGTAGDFVQLHDAGTTDVTNLGHVPTPGVSGSVLNLVWEAAPTTFPFTDQTNLGDEFRNGLQIDAKVTTATNGSAFNLYLYHGLS